MIAVLLTVIILGIITLWVVMHPIKTIKGIVKGLLVLVVGSVVFLGLGTLLTMAFS